MAERAVVFVERWPRTVGWVALHGVALAVASLIYIGVG